MIVTTIISGYAAVVGTASLGWQAWRARRADAHGITTSVSFAIVGTSPPVQAVCVKAVNARGARSIGVTSAGLDLQDGSGGTFVVANMEPPTTIPGTVQPGHALEAYLSRNAIDQAGFDLTRPITGFVRLATGEILRSDPTTLII